MTSSYDPLLVALSVFIAAVASYAALDLAGRVTEARGGTRAGWLGGGALAMGIGIWSMHYTGMLAFQLPVPVYYDVPTVALSLLAAIFASVIALWVVSRHEMGLREAIPGSVVMGLGIAAMHYIGMAAMRLRGVMDFDPGLVALSIGIAIVVSFVALWLAFRLRVENMRGWVAKKVGSAVVMGVAVASMHYTGMAAAGFSRPQGIVPPPTGVEVTALGFTGIVVTTLMVLLLAIGTSAMGRRLMARTTALATSEQERRTQELYLRRVIDADPQLVFAKDWEGRFTLANKAVAEVYGTTPEELLGKTDADFNPDLAEVESFLRDDREVMTSGQTKRIPEEPVTNPVTGETRFYETIKVPLQLEGESPQILGVATDVTERKALEEQLLQAQKMDAVGRLAGGIAHDFNNLLTVMLGNLAVVLADTPEDDDRREALQEVMSAVERATSLTRQLLTFSRKQDMTPEVLDLNHLVEGIYDLLDRLIGEEVRIQLRLLEGSTSVRADSGKLEQVIINLAINARDAMPDGGTLTLATEKFEVGESLASEHIALSPGSYVILSVSDTGVGMDAETRTHVFEPFFTTKEPGKGTGLGLSMVYGIVNQSGGYVRVQSEPGEGATFQVFLPRIADAGSGSEPRGPVSVSESGSEAVMEAEDSTHS